jgi:tetratricopeptide (TPR) repeat protein
VVAEPVATRRLAATLLRLLGVEGALPGEPLPGFGDGGAGESAAVFSEATMPAEVYGWAPLAAITTGRWRYVDAPRPELYDIADDPGELVNLVDERPEEAARLRADLDRLRDGLRVAGTVPPELDRDTRAALGALGYLEGRPGRPGDGIDPKDGVELLEGFRHARRLLAEGRVGEARRSLDGLVARNPSNVPFLSRLAEAQMLSGAGEDAVQTLGRALELHPGSELLLRARADTFARMGRTGEAAAGYRAALDVDPRSAPAWLGLAGVQPTVEGRRQVLAEARAAGVDSGVVLLESARLEAEAGRAEAARELLDRAAALMPGAAVVWLERARLDLEAGALDGALAACARATELEPGSPEAALCTGRVRLARGEPERARPHLQRAAVLGRGTAVEAEARRLLEWTRN